MLQASIKLQTFIQKLEEPLEAHLAEYLDLRIWSLTKPDKEEA